MNQQQGPPAAGGMGMTIGCKADNIATSAGATLPRRAHQPGSSWAAANGKSARTHRRKQKMAQNKAEPVQADEEMVCADQQQDETMAEDTDSWDPQQEETTQPLMCQAQGSALTELMHPAAAAVFSCDSEQQRQQQAAEALLSVGHISAQPLQPPSEDGVEQPSQDQEVALESQRTGSCMGGAGDRWLATDQIILTTQHALAIRAVSHRHHHTLFAPLWEVWLQCGFSASSEYSCLAFCHSHSCIALFALYTVAARADPAFLQI